MKSQKATGNEFDDAQEQGCEVRVDTGVGLGRSRPFCMESELELESVKFGRLRLRPGVHTDTRQRTMILDKRSCTLPKTLEDRKEERGIDAW